MPPHVRRLVDSKLAAEFTGEETLSHLFDCAYAWLSRHYRSEYVYKNEVVSRIVFGRHSPRTTSFQTEFRTGTSIADAVVFNGTSTVYEIKTELDGFNRLATQLQDYLMVFDRVFVVTHDEGIEAALTIVPEQVGVIRLTRKGSLSEVRSCTSNVGGTSPVAIFNTLRRSEYLPILSRLTGWTADVPVGHIYSAARERFAALSPLSAHEAALSAWRARTVSGGLPAFALQLPTSLRTLGLTEPLSSIGKLRALTCLSAPLASV